jgi:HEAT repeat protein
VGRLWAFDWSEPPSGDPERALIALGQQAVQPMIDTLKTGNAMGRRRAIGPLEKLAAERALKRIREKQAKPDAER